MPHSALNTLVLAYEKKNDQSMKGTLQIEVGAGDLPRALLDGRIHASVTQCSASADVKSVPALNS